MRRRAPIPLLLLALVAGSCGSEPEPPPAPPSREPEGPPPVPSIDSLDSPSAGRSTVALPEWNADRIRFEHDARELRARFGIHESVTQVLLGEAVASGLLLNYYGARLEAGDVRVLPATDETRSEHAGRDSRVFTLAFGVDQGALRSQDGTVTILAADEAHVTGTFDVRVQSRVMLRETRVRGRFHATPDRLITAELEHQAAIREQLRNR